MLDFVSIAFRLLKRLVDGEAQLTTPLQFAQVSIAFRLLKRLVAAAVKVVASDGSRESQLPFGC